MTEKLIDASQTDAKVSETSEEQEFQRSPGTRPEPISHLPRRPYEEEMQKIPEPVTPLSLGPVPDELMEEPHGPPAVLSDEEVRDRRWLFDHLDDLKRTNAEQWIAVWQERVIAAGEDLDEVVTFAEASCPGATPVYWLVGWYPLFLTAPPLQVLGKYPSMRGTC